MKRLALLAYLITLASLAFAQTVITSSGQATTQGAAITPAPVSGPLLIAPQVHLGAPAPTVGATSATMGNTAGAASSTSQISQPPSVTTMVPEVSLGQGVIYQVPVPVTAAAPSSQVVVVAPQSAAGAAPATTLAGFDRGVSTPGPWEPTTGVGTPGLAEYARARQQNPNVHARTYTNQDIDRMPNHGVGGTSGAAVSAGATSYPANNGVITNPPAVAQPAGATPPPAQPQNPAMPVTPSAQPPAKPSAGQPSTQPLPPIDMAQANVPPSPADQQAQPPASQPSGRDQLPRSGTVLPLMAIVGLLAAAAGLLSR